MKAKAAARKLKAKTQCLKITKKSRIQILAFSTNFWPIFCYFCPLNRSRCWMRLFLWFSNTVSQKYLLLRELGFLMKKADYNFVFCYLTYELYCANAIKGRTRKNQEFAWYLVFFIWTTTKQAAFSQFT